jgi:hypothetical protein
LTRFALLLVALAACLVSPPPSAAGATRTFAASADAFVASAQPSVEHGRHRQLIVDRSRSPRASRMAYVKFDVVLPTGATVTGARLRLYSAGAAHSRTSLLRVGNGWTETGVNWRNRPAALSAVVSRDRARGRGWRALRVGVVAAGEQSFVLRARGRTAAHYRSRESARGPRLVVRYTPAASTSPPAPTSIGCPVARPQASWRAPGSPPLSDAQAAACVTRSGENRPQNANQNAKLPTAAELDAFRTARDAGGRTPAQYNRNFAHVTGAAAAYGLRSTDDLIEWAAYKWGIPEDLVRGQMVMESGWSMLQKGDRRDWTSAVSSLYPALAVIDADSVWESLGIAQIRWRHTIPWNPGVEPLRWQSTAFALDYSQALIRYYYDGLCSWCGAGYVAGDADGAYRSYVSGSWTDGQWYADGVRSNAASKPWLPIPPP